MRPVARSSTNGNDTFILVTVFALLLIMNVPIAVSIALASFAAIWSRVRSLYRISWQNGQRCQLIALLAIPFFVFSGHLMGKGGMARRLTILPEPWWVSSRWSSLCQYLTCMLFGSISGSASAAVSSVGGFMIRNESQGYNREFNVAVTTTAATTGLMIPSNIMIVYSVAAGSVSIAAVFMAESSRCLTGLFIMLVCGYFALKEIQSRAALIH